jgi:hypothetical protein
MYESTHNATILVLLQVHQAEGGNLDSSYTEQLASSNPDEMSTRWREIYQRIKVDTSLDKEKQQQLYKVLERYQDVFAWNKGELGCCTIEQHFVGMQGFPPCKVSPS